MKFENIASSSTDQTIAASITRIKNKWLRYCGNIISILSMFPLVCGSACRNVGRGLAFLLVVSLIRPLFANDGKTATLSAIPGAGNGRATAVSPRAIAPSAWRMKICSVESAGQSCHDSPWHPFRGLTYVQEKLEGDSIWLESMVPARREEHFLLLNNLWSNVDVFAITGDSGPVLPGPRSPGFPGPHSTATVGFVEKPSVMRQLFTSRDRFMGGYPGLLVDLPSLKDGDTLLLRITSPYPRIGLADGPVLATEGELLRRVVEAEWPILLGSLFVLSISLAAFPFALRPLRYGRRAVLWFSLSTFLMSVSSLSVTQTVRIFLHNAIWPYLLGASTVPLWMATFLLLLAKTQSGPLRLLVRILIGALVFLGCMRPLLIVLYVHSGLYWIMFYDMEILSVGLMVASIATVLFLSLGTLWRSGRGRRAAVGGVVLSIPGLLSYLTSYITQGQSYLYIWGLFLFVALSLLSVKKDLSRLDGYMTRNTRRLLRERMALRRERFRSLQNRMSPHFLMNLLSVFYALLEQKRVEDVRSALIWLSDHYRFLTDRAQENLIPLREEIDFTENYLQIQRLRFPDRLDYRVIRQEEEPSHGTSSREERNPTVPNPSLPPPYIPPLSLQPLVENAIQHGVRRSKGDGRITLKYSTTGEAVRLEVRDTGPGFEDGFRRDRTLENIQKRLRLFYRMVKLEILRDPVAGETVVTLTYGGAKE